MNIVIVAAVAAELKVDSLPAYCTTLLTGVGPLEAGIALTHFLTKTPVELVINVGVAGTLREDLLPIGSAAFVRDETYVDLGRQDGTPLQLPSDIPVWNTASCDRTLLDSLTTSLIHSRHERVAGITSATVTTTDERAAALRRWVPDAMLESMEGFAVARTAQRLGIPSLQIRGISNRVGDSASAAWDLAAGVRASHRLLTATLGALESLKKG